MKTELNGATSVIWLKQQKKGRGLPNLIYRCFEYVPPFIVSFTAAKKNLLGHSPPMPDDVIKKPLCDCWTSLLRAGVVAMDMCSFHTGNHMM